MECDLIYDGPSEKVPGWSRYKCQRAPCPVVNHSPYDISRQVAGNCQGWPYPSELGNACELLLESNGVTPRGWATLIYRLGLVEVPESACQSCDARKRWLNSIGGKLCASTSRLGRFLAWLLVRRALAPGDGMG